MISLTDLSTEFRRQRSEPNLPPPRPDSLRRHRAPVNAATLPDPAMTNSMREVERIVTRLANARDAMPNNPILGELAGGRGRSSVLRALRRLIVAGVLTGEKQGSQRRFTVVATGRCTEWGEARPGHSPYLHRKPGDPSPAERPRTPRAPLSRPLPPQMLPMLRGDMPEIVLPPEPQAPTRPSRRPSHALTCQFPMWADGERPGANPKFCDGPASAGHSFCDAHRTDCFREARQPTNPHGMPSNFIGMPGPGSLTPRQRFHAGA